MLGALGARDDLALEPYVVSFRARLDPTVRRVRVPAALAHRLWHWGRPRVLRHLGRGDVVHGTNYVVPPSRAARVVSVYDCWFLEHPEGVDPVVRRVGGLLRRAIADGATVHVSSRATADRLASLVEANRVEVIPLGCDPVPPPPDGMPPPPGLGSRPYVLALGTRERRKNLPRLVEAFGLMAARTDDLALVIAGAAGNDDTAIVQQVGVLPPKARARVLVLDYVDEATRRWLLHHATVLAYPSLDEGFGFPLLEAMGAGAAVVASTAGSIPEVAGDAALLVPPDDSMALAEALDDALDPTRHRRLVAAGRERAGRFSWPETAAGLSRLYHALAMGATG
jgi:glycosyltransferase involved in cell wall biosynthesis